MLDTTLWRNVLGVEKNTIIEDVELDADEEEILVADIRPCRKLKPRCGKCEKPAPGYDPGRRRRWRGLDLSSVKTYLEADAPRVECPDHGVTVAWVPWARHNSGHTRCFDDQCAWLATVSSKSAVVELMRLAWRSVGAIIERVWADTAAEIDFFAGLRRIGIGEISYKKGHKYLTVVVDHDSKRLVWAKSGRSKETLRSFFTDLEASGAGRCGQITHVTADGADWIGDVVTEQCPNAIRCADPFHLRGVLQGAVSGGSELARSGL